MLSASSRCPRTQCEFSRSFLQDATFTEIMAFLDAADLHGKSIPTRISSGDPGSGYGAPGAGRAQGESAPRTVSQEARILKSIFLKLRD